MTQDALDRLKSIFTEPDPARQQRRFLLALLDMQHVERGSIWVRRAGGYECIDAVGLQSEQIRGVRLAADRASIVGWVIEHGEWTIADPRRDRRHFKDLEANLALKSSLILCFPLCFADGRVYGAVQVIDTSPEQRNINRDEGYLRSIQDLVDIGAIVLGNTLQRQAGEPPLPGRRIAGTEATLVAQSTRMIQVLDQCDQFAQTDYPVLITGASGTGKELIARRLHRRSPRRQRPFVVQNCSAIPENLLESELFGYRKGAFSGATADRPGLFEAAAGGTVLLDEIGDMPLNLQARILRVIQSGEVKPLGDPDTRRVDIRVVAATNRNIQKMVLTNEFRQDLYYRLSVLPLHLPPLRERPGDIPLLLDYFIARESAKLGIAPKTVPPDTLVHLVRHRWPGNVRELENLVRYLLVVTPGDAIPADSLPSPLGTLDTTGDPIAPRPDGSDRPVADRTAKGGAGFGDMTWREMEVAYAHHLLAVHRNNLSRAAAAADLNRSTFVSRLKRLGIHPGKA